MLIPRFWAEAWARQRERNRQITIRRFGWSDVSQDDSQAMAEARANEALQRAIRGEVLVRREAAVAYSGVGLPIREEILETLGRAVVTRNSYGARCLNTPDVLFADVDAEPPSIWWPTLLSTVLAAAGAWWLSPPTRRGVLALVVFLVAYAIFNTVVRAIWGRFQGSEARVRSGRDRIARFVAGHPGWAVRIYRTPSGLRAMATHRRFAPGDPEVRACFDAIRVDKVYAQMCANQQCFRARLTPKPWRMGMKPMTPRAAWPVPPEKRPQREAWVAQYEAASRGYAACRFVEAVGSGAVDIDVETVRRFHDDACRALDERLPIA
jgi:hypothetical protein